jgi:hypothetical protein
MLSEGNRTKFQPQIRPLTNKRFPRAGFFGFFKIFFKILAVLLPLFPTDPHTPLFSPDFAS